MKKFAIKGLSYIYNLARIDEKEHIRNKNRNLCIYRRRVDLDSFVN